MSKSINELKVLRPSKRESAKRKNIENEHLSHSDTVSSGQTQTLQTENTVKRKKTSQDNTISTYEVDIKVEKEIAEDTEVSKLMDNYNEPLEDEEFLPFMTSEPNTDLPHPIPLYPFKAPVTLLYTAAIYPQPTTGYLQCASVYPQPSAQPTFLFSNISGSLSLDDSLKILQCLPPETKVNNFKVTYSGP